MIRGEITPDREPLIRLVVRGPGGREDQMEAVVDTGFNGYLTLAPARVAVLSLTPHGTRRAMLADGSSVYLNVYEAAVDWNGRTRDVLVLAADGGPLVGMSLLYGCLLTMEIVDGGPVIIEPLRPDSSLAQLGPP
jgi:clan AA aspartic protease